MLVYVAVRVFSGRGGWIRTNTSGFGDRATTIILHPYMMQSRKDSNLEPQSQSLIRCQLHYRTKLRTLVVSTASGALFPPYHAYHSLSDFGRMLKIRYVGISGLGPLTSRLSGVRSNQLSYIPEASPVSNYNVTPYWDCGYNSYV